MIDDKKFAAILEKATKKTDAVWQVVVTGDCNDANDAKEIRTFDEDGFKKEGLPMALILYHIRYVHLWEEYDWADEIVGSEGYDYVPSDENGWAHTIDGVEVTGPNGILDLSLISKEEAEYIVRDFLTNEYDEACCGHDFDIEEVIGDLFNRRKRH